MKSLKNAVRDVQESYQRCLQHEDFFGVFYGIFLETSEEIATMFAKTDWHRQKSLIQQAIRSAILFAQEPDVPLVRQHMERIALSHSKTQRNVRPELYPFWLDSMVAAAATCDPKFSKSLEKSWRRVLSPAIQFISSHYDIYENSGSVAKNPQATEPG